MKKKLLILLISLAALCAAVCGFAACDKVSELLFGAPENISYDGAYITWDRVEAANHYTVSIDGGEPQRSNSTTYAYVSDAAFEVTVTAVFDESETSASVTFKPLAKIEAVYVSDDGGIRWDAVAGANAYLVSVNGESVTVTETFYQPAEGRSRVRVRPIVSGDPTYYSLFSEETSVTVYGSPSNVQYDGTTLRWTGNAASYRVTIGGASETVTGNSYLYDSGNADFAVTITALGDHVTTYDSAARTEEFHYLDPVGELYVEDGVIRWNAVDGAEGYRVRVGGVVRATVTGTEYAELAAGTSQDVAVLPVNETGNYFSAWSAEKSVYILETPAFRWNNELDLDGQANNNYTWDAVNAAAGYTVRLTHDGQTVTSDFPTAQRFFAHAYEEVGTYTVEVKATAAVGSADYYDSKYSTPVVVQRLAAPQAAADSFIVSDRNNLGAGFTVNYQSVAGASGYQLYKEGAPVASGYTAGTALSDRNVADETQIDRRQYTYTVRAMGGMRTVSGHTYVTLPSLTASSLSFTITVQASPQALTMSGFVLSWNAVAGSSGYAVSYAGSANTAQTESYDLSTLSPGTYAIAVAARGNGGATLPSNYSAPVTVQRLEAPSSNEITISSAANGTLNWREVAYATGYNVYLGLSETALDTDSYDDMFQFISTEGTTLSMVAVANYYNADRTVYYMTSPASPTKQFTRLLAPVFPEGAVANSVELLWNAPANVNTGEYTPTYAVYSAIGEQIGGGNISGTRFNIEALEGGGTYTFYVRAIGNGTQYIDSDYSQAITVYKLAAPQIRIENNQYVWSGVTNASSYYLAIDGVRVSDEYHVSGSTYSYTPRYTSAGDHTVTLYAVGDGVRNLNSAAHTFTQRAALLATPTIAYSYSSDTYVTNGSIGVTVTSAVPHSAGYQYEIAGETATSSSLTYSKTVYNTGSYTVRVRALGGVIEEGVYYIDSLYAEGSGPITLLGAPSQPSFSINSDGVIRWDAVSGCFGYDFQISFDGGAYEDIEHTSYNNLDVIANYRQYRTIRVRVRACGNSASGGTVVTSGWAEWTWTNSAYGG